MENPRAVARAAVRGQLALEAIAHFMADGFDDVTLSDLASASGVSRSTMLRYFGTKEELVLALLDSVGADIAKEIVASPAGEDDWVVLRRAIETLTIVDTPPLPDMNTGKVFVAFIYGTPDLHRALVAKYVSWVPLLEEALVGRGSDPFESRVRAAAALDCLRLASEEWVADPAPAAEDGSDLRVHLARAFHAVAGI